MNPSYDLAAVSWRKSSYSDAHGGDCIEVGALPWRKSSHSGSTGGECVEIAPYSALVAVRDSKNPEGTVLAFGRGAFRTLTEEIRAGHYT